MEARVSAQINSLAQKIDAQKKELMDTFDEKFKTGFHQLGLEIENRDLARMKERANH